MHKLKQLLLYAGTDRESFERLKPELIAGSSGNLRAFTSIGGSAMLIMFVLSFFVSTLAKNRVPYGLCVFACLVLFGVSFAGKDRLWLVLTGIYIFVGMLFAFGIALGTFITPDQITVSFVILLFAAPLLFTDIPLRMTIAIVSGIVLYILAAYITQTPAMFKMNLVDVLMYGTLSIIISSYMMTIKVHRIHLEIENKFLSGWDILTGLKNRRSFEADLTPLRSANHDRYLICALDVNGLKRVNDNIGHAAGDELLQGAAECIQAVFGACGTCYRVGGDEFMAILDRNPGNPQQLREEFEKITSRWSGKYIQGISVSVGVVSSNESDSLDDILALADKRMYEQKAAYYKTINAK